MEAPKEPLAVTHTSPTHQEHEQNHVETPPSSPKNSLFSWFRLWMIIIVAVLGILFLGLWFFQSQSHKSATLTSTKPSPSVSSKKIVVGIDPTLEPMEFIENGKMVGYDIDLANALGEEMGTPVEFKNIVFDDLFKALDQRQIDMIISAVTITSERQQQYDFSKEYLNAGQVIITQKTNTTITSTANLKGKRIAVQKGTTNETAALQYTADALVLRYPDFEAATKALVEGKADALFTDLPNAKGITVANPTLKIASDPFTNEYYGVVFRKGDKSITRVNTALNSLYEKGILAELKAKWLK